MVRHALVPCRNCGRRVTANIPPGWHGTHLVVGPSGPLLVNCAGLPAGAVRP